MCFSDFIKDFLTNLLVFKINEPNLNQIFFRYFSIDKSYYEIYIDHAKHPPVSKIFLNLEASELN